MRIVDQEDAARGGAGAAGDRKSGVHSPRVLLPWIALVSVWFLWGSTYVGIRYAVKTIPPFLMSGSRYVIAGLVLLGVLAAVKRGLPAVTPRQVLSTAIAGAIMLLGGNGLALLW